MVPAEADFPLPSEQMPGYGWAIWCFGLTALPAQPLLQPYKQVRLLRALIPGDSSLQAVGAANSLVQGEV